MDDSSKNTDRKLNEYFDNVRSTPKVNQPIVTNIPKENDETGIQQTTFDNKRFIALKTRLHGIYKAIYNNKEIVIYDSNNFVILSTGEIKTLDDSVTLIPYKYPINIGESLLYNLFNLTLPVNIKMNLVWIRSYKTIGFIDRYTLTHHRYLGNEKWLEEGNIKIPVIAWLSEKYANKIEWYSNIQSKNDRFVTILTDINDINFIYKLEKGKDKRKEALKGFCKINLETRSKITIKDKNTTKKRSCIIS
jgi:hypothetical protein